MSSTPRSSLIKHFGTIYDPRRQGSVDHPLQSLVISAVCAVIAGANTWPAVQLFVANHMDWFSAFLNFPNGVPCDETYRRVFSLIDSEELETQFMLWVEELRESGPERFIAIDGKTLRGSRCQTQGLKPLHIVSAWPVENHLLLGQLKVEDKTNEITAIPKLLSWLDLEGCVVTIDAMGCQKDIAEKIIAKRGDYVLALKDNHPTLAEDVERFFAECEEGDFKGVWHDSFETSEKGHGREETRRYLTISTEDLKIEGAEGWANLKTVGRVVAERTLKGETSLETRYFLASLENHAKRFAKAIRGHWSIENNLHWQLDVSFSEDKSKIRDRRGAENFSVLRRIGLLLLKRDKSIKVGIETKRQNAGWNLNYLAKVVGIEVK